MQDWTELEAYITANHRVTYRSEFLVFIELTDGSTAMVQEGFAIGRDYETIRVEVDGFENEADSAYRVLNAVQHAGNGLLTCEELAGKLFIRHIVATELLTGPEFDTILRWVASVAAQIRARRRAGELVAQPE